MLLATPADLPKLIKLNKPVARVYWKLETVEDPTIPQLVEEFLSRKGPKAIP